ncbi:GntR family transcriptional regulator [Rhodococcus rhodochrous]|uniref:GntR family transcriptional regulator n=1 Tax=Rhodococcus rhodochrous TaxID=1829 RepID=UPI00177A9BED|nr:GntR family transcriptional regulator [Rhodococcus rhodochrous]
MARRTVSRATAAELAAERLYRAILTGELPGSSPVYEEEWATKLGISRTPVREAIQELVARGLLIRQGRTAYVFRPSLKELFEIYDIRLPLEQLAASRCAELADARLVEDLESAYAKIRERRSDTDWYADHEVFHMKLYEGSQMPRLTAMIRSLRAQSEPYVRLAVNVDQEFRDNSRIQHSSLVQAIREGAPELAADIVREHLGTTRQKVSDLVRATASLSGRSPDELPWL